MKIAIVFAWWFIFLGQQRGPFRDLADCNRIKAELVAAHAAANAGYVSRAMPPTSCWDDAPSRAWDGK